MTNHILGEHLDLVAEPLACVAHLVREDFCLLGE